MPLTANLKSLRLGGPAPDKLRALFAELELTNLSKLLDHGVSLKSQLEYCKASAQGRC